MNENYSDHLVHSYTSRLAHVTAIPKRFTRSPKTFLRNLPSDYMRNEAIRLLFAFRILHNNSFMDLVEQRVGCRSDEMRKAACVVRLRIAIAKREVEGGGSV
ncbi:hypothetical protein GWI33_021466 [Rhynchophorus ferrugineus]|uniref:Uncharacterized protein n=1 Tax=Rhynchophorus ferrugineus TaxID=354439 RepID=A0A834HMP2_RHYFE|nr:hypothetical protein GWI33_021467 [Rhynchophorus ferrugineus]KAF7265116.1 hypothetical protein GWI33_021466 [Rhynchophorus ferrugineus]